MSKGNLFVGSGSGKVGNLVLANTKSGQVTRVYQPKVHNPKTYAQMYQRAKFADAVKFFKAATAGFFRFAFEDKSQNESDYNAFMRHNVTNAVPMSRELYLNNAVPAIGSVFQMSQGRLNLGATLSFATKTTAVAGGPADDIQITLPGAAAAETIGAVSKVLIDGGLQAGDIITIVRIGSYVGLDEVQNPGTIAAGTLSPTWTIYQFVLNADDTTALTSVPAIGFGTSNGVRALTLGSDSEVLTASFDSGKAQWGAALVTRKSASGLLSCDSFLLGDSVAKSVESYVLTDAVVNNAVVSWGSNGAAILKGAIAGLA